MADPEGRSVSDKTANGEPMAASVTTSGKTAVQGNSQAPQAAAPSAQPRSSSQPRQASVASMAAAPLLRKTPSSNLAPSASPSAGASPQTSRNASPVRKDGRPTSLTNPVAKQPSAAALQRALSATNVPQLQSGVVTEAVSRLPRSAKSVGGVSSGDTTPQWPVSPRWKSPPPSAASSRRGSAVVQKKADAGNGAPSISVQAATPTANSHQVKPPAGEEPRKGDHHPQLQSIPKATSRGPSGKSMLETVQETSADSIGESPAAMQAAADLKPLTKISEESKDDSKTDGPDGEKHTQPGESGSESAGSKAEQKRGRRSSLTLHNKNHHRPPNTSKGNFATLGSGKSRQAEGKPNMTVETETVASIPQSALDRSAGGRTESGTLRLKPSNETIRPKKERRKVTQKVRSVTQGTGTSHITRSPLLIYHDPFERDGAQSDSVISSSFSSTTAVDDVAALRRSPRKHAASHHWHRAISYRSPSKYLRTFSDRWLRKASSKADIFEQRVANAVDEANASDSDETFVYESNPPDSQRRPRHHSRTPSVTSAHSTVEQQRGGIRAMGDVLDERRVNGKRSMKFSNNPYHEVDSPDSKNGTVRSSQARHFGKFGRDRSHASLNDQDSPYTQASKLRSNHLITRNSRPNSPKSPRSAQQQKYSGLFGRKEQSFDFDAEGADDERTPLIGTVRAPRSARHARRLHTDNTVRNMDDHYRTQPRSRWSRFNGCLLGFFVIIAVVLSAVAFLAMSNRPMYDVKIRRIQNVLASEQEIMLDLLVGAVNPNVLGITVSNMDVNVFAKSKHVGNSPLHFDRSATLVSLPSNRPRTRRDSSPAANDGNSNPWQDLSGRRHGLATNGGVDHGTDPPEDDDLEKDAQTMLLGRIFHFDQALMFEASPIKRHPHFSLGEVRLAQPGNETETGGSARWETVLKYPFELIVRGVLKYQLPVSNRMQSVSVGASVVVHPEDGVDDAGNMRVEPINHDEHWQWIDWDDILDDCLPKYDHARSE